MRRLVLLGTPRCGSRLVSGMLGSHPDVRMWDEPFNPNNRPHLLPHHPTVTFDEIRAMGRDYYEWFWRQPCSKRVLGFSHHLHSLGWRPTRWALEDVRATKVLVRRANLLAQYVSLLEAAQTRQWSLDAKTPRREPAPVTVDAQAFARFADRQVRAYEFAEQMMVRSGQQFYSVVYEMVREHRLQILLAYLGLPPADLRPWTRKQSARPLAERVVNWQGLQAEMPERYRHFASWLSTDEVT